MDIKKEISQKPKDKKRKKYSTQFSIMHLKTISTFTVMRKCLWRDGREERLCVTFHSKGLFVLFKGRQKEGG